MNNHPGDPHHIHPLDEDDVTFGQIVKYIVICVLALAIIFYAVSGIWFWHFT